MRNLIKNTLLLIPFFLLIQIGYAEDTFELIYTITVPAVPAESTRIVSVTPVGDYNADGYGDLVLGVRCRISNADYYEAAYLYYGGPSFDTEYDLLFLGDPQDLILCGGAEARATLFGLGATGLADFNCDGYDDFAISAASLCNNNKMLNGRVYIYFGSPNPDTTADLIIDGIYEFDYFGLYMIFGNYNGDSYGDFLTYTLDHFYGQQIYLFFGNDPPDNQYDWLCDYRGTINYATFVRGGFDINNDEFDDFGWFVNLHKYIIFLGGNPPDDNPVDSIPNTTCIFPGDVSGDGIDDFLLGALGALYLCLGGDSLDFIPDYVLPHVHFSHSFIYTLPNNEDKLMVDVWHLKRFEMYNTGVPFDTVPYNIINYNFNHGPTQVNIGDINADGIEDIALSDSAGPNLYIYSIFQTAIEDMGDVLPVEAELIHAYPNPFNAACRITVSDPRIELVEIYDITGRLVERLDVASGSALWDAAGRPSGIYFARGKNNTQTIMRKLVFLK